MIQPYTDAVQVPETQQPALPAPVKNAVKVMYAGAVVCAIHAIVYLVTAGAEKAAVATKYPHLSAGGVDTVMHIIVIAGAVAALLAAAMFIWLGRSSRGGKNWARVTGTVLFAIAILGALHDLAEPETTVNLAFVFAECLIGLVAVVLLWRRSSSAYFSFFSRPQF
jgi:hypothetical protein